MTEFRVDTHLFRELGALLVGRDSTALAELIKNCYDADATDVYIRGTDLKEKDLSRVIVSDNGNGMTRPEFERGFLTIAARSKSGLVRHSPLYGRRYTGAKGIGRLAAHKLAHVLDIESVPNPNVAHRGTKPYFGVKATLDWDVIESFNHLDEVGDALVVDTLKRSISNMIGSHGTVITLSRLRRAWTDKDLAEFVAEVQGYEPPEAVLGAVKGTLYSSPLLPQGLKVRGPRPAVGSSRGAGKGFKRSKPFTLHLEGDFDRGEDLAPQPAETAQYVLEIDSRPKALKYGVARTKAGEKSLREELRTPIPAVTLPALAGGPYFQARVFVRSGSKSSWPKSVTGVRVYMEGFRVLPYGEPGNDWLSTDSQYTMRGRELVSLGGKYADDALFGDQLKDEGLSMLPATGYIGGVFLTEDSSGGLQMLVNREGFVPGPAFDALTTTVRRGIDYVTRIRARDKAARLRGGTGHKSVVTRTRTQALTERTAEMHTLVKDVEKAVRSGDQDTVRSAVRELSLISEEVASVTDDLLEELNMIRVLASVGSQLSAFVHELNGLLAVTEATQKQLDVARSNMAPRESRATARVSRLLEEVRRGLDRQASYLTDVTSADARRRRSAQRLNDRVEAVYRMLSLTAQRRQVRLSSDVDPDIRTRPMFRAELTAILTNVLTNAIKAATPDEALSDDGTHARTFDGDRGTTGDDTDEDFVGDEDSDDSTWGRVFVSGTETADGTTIIVANTGEKVDLEDAEKWFEPYASTTTETDPVLGQGTGLGLTITRSLVSENAGTVQFAAPPPGYATALSIHFPPRRRR